MTIFTKETFSLKELCTTVNEYISKKNNYYAFNTLGFCKDIFDIYELKSNDYINESNNHGIYIKNIINITNNNINNYMDIISKNENLNMHLFICDEKYDFEIKDNEINNFLYKLNSNI